MKSVQVLLLSCAGSLVVCAAASAQFATVEDAMDAIVTRYYETMTLDELSALDHDQVLASLMPAEREALSTGHLRFTVNVPVVVSVMRHTRQARVPFWLPEAGFKKTEMTVVNTEGWEYEVWQKRYRAGTIGLGINGFSNHRPHYFVSVAPQDPSQELVVGERYPAEFPLGWMAEGAYVYNDWSSLLLEEVPDELEGETLFTTIRGRARATHLVGGFRRTPYPASEAPDSVALSWTESPQSTMTVQWRGSMDTSRGLLRVYRVDSETAVANVRAEEEIISDRLLANDRYTKRYTATVRGLESGRTYQYSVAFEDDFGRRGIEVRGTFETAPAEDEPFTFLAFGDTQSIEPWGPVLNAALTNHPDAAFATIAGDVVGTGQYRDDWDRFYRVAQPLTRRIPLLPALGNHDVIDGLGAGMWRATHALPKNGPPDLEPERVYSFEYSNALIVVLDSGLPVIDQAAWLENALANTDADWKIVVYHFPPYNYEHPYPKIEALWGYLFDKYEVDIAFEGHIHYYMRSKPMYRGRPQPPGSRGTTHVLTIAIPNRERKLPPADYAAVQFTGIGVYNVVEINGDTLTCRALDAEGNERDSFTLRKGATTTD